MTSVTHSGPTIESDCGNAFAWERPLRVNVDNGARTPRRACMSCGRAAD
jgi:hypothetical protein